MDTLDVESQPSQKRKTTEFISDEELRKLEAQEKVRKQIELHHGILEDIILNKKPKPLPGAFMEVNVEPKIDLDENKVNFQYNNQNTMYQTPEFDEHEEKRRSKIVLDKWLQDDPNMEITNIPTKNFTQHQINPREMKMSEQEQIIMDQLFEQKAKSLQRENFQNELNSLKPPPDVVARTHATPMTPKEIIHQRNKFSLKKIGQYEKPTEQDGYFNISTEAKTIKTRPNDNETNLQPKLIPSILSSNNVLPHEGAIIKYLEPNNVNNEQIYHINKLKNIELKPSVNLKNEPRVDIQEDENKNWVFDTITKGLKTKSKITTHTPINDYLDQVSTGLEKLHIKKIAMQFHPVNQILEKQSNEEVKIQKSFKVEPIQNFVPKKFSLDTPDSLFHSKTKFINLNKETLSEQKVAPKSSILVEKDRPIQKQVNFNNSHKNLQENAVIQFFKPLQEDISLKNPILLHNEQLSSKSIPKNQLSNDSDSQSGQNINLLKMVTHDKIQLPAIISHSIMEENLLLPKNDSKLSLEEKTQPSFHLEHVVDSKSISPHFALQKIDVKIQSSPIITDQNEHISNEYQEKEREKIESQALLNTDAKFQIQIPKKIINVDNHRHKTLYSKPIRIPDTFINYQKAL